MALPFIPTHTYNVNDWYWQVGGSTDQVFASGRMAYVPVTDATYVAWLATGKLATVIAEARDLYDVLVQQWAPSYVQTVEVQSTGTSALDGFYPMDAQTQAQITSIATSITAGRGLPGGSSTFVFQGHVFNQTQFLNFATAVENYIYNFYQALGQIVLTGSGSLPSQPITMP
jgi:hypothetical protein